MFVHLAQAEFHSVDRFGAEEHRLDRRLQTVERPPQFDILF